MNTSNSEMDLQIQRCVDGELSNADEAAFLRQCDIEPLAWRRLALTFVEDRLIRQAVHTHLTVDAAPEEVSRKAHWPTSVGGYGQLARLLALSICFGVVLELTWMQWTRPAEPNAVPLAAVEPQTTEQHAPTTPPIARVQQPVDTAMLSPASNGSVRPADQLNVQRNGAESVSLPVFHPQNINPEMLPKRPEVPRELRDQLQRRGYAIDQQREYMVIPLEDGRRVLIPQDTVHVRYAVQ